ncbi:hypothetical protein BGY98DRAFT_541013 [Russula aff. rugulosa BPL654]|nr:hypothetical protein BGY98DRAFT_541013 [Russula aff. rugulosa BPL654]
MEETKISLNQDVRAIRWLIDRISGSDEMQALALAIPGSFNGKWGQEVWKGVVRDQSTSPANLQARSLPGFPSTRQGTTVYKLCRRMRHFFEAHKYEGNFVDAGSVHTRRMRAYVETAASLVCCADVKLDSFGDIAYVLSEVGDKEQTNNTLSIGLNPLFTVRWTCLSLVAIKQIINDNRLQELVKLALDGITSFQTNLGSRLGDTVTTALTVSQKMDHDLKKAWGAVLDLRLALESRSQSQNQTESGIRSILITSSCEASIQELERIATEAVGLKEVDWRIRFLQETMDEVTHKLTRRLPGAFFDELRPTAPIMTIEASDLPSVQTTPFPPQLIFPGQQLQSIYILGQRLRDITQRQNTEWDEETLKSLKYLREVPIPLCGFNYLMERQIWRLLDLRDGGGLGFTIELFFLALRQLSSASPSSESKKVFYAGTFDVITSNWEKSKNSAGTQRILLDLLCDLIIQGRGIFSDFRYPGYIVEMLLDLVGKTVEGLGQTGHPHIDNLYNELMDGSLMNRMDVVLRDKTLSTIRRALDTVSS